MPRMNVTSIAPLLAIAATLHAQTFDAASIKRSASDIAGGSTFEFLTGGGMRVKNGTLIGLIESAYDVREFQIVGGPSWLNADRYDVFARSRSGEAATISAEEMKATRLKLRALLADRFQLVVHRETRELPEYALAVEQSGSRLVV